MDIDNLGVAHWTTGIRIAKLSGLLVAISFALVAKAAEVGPLPPLLNAAAAGDVSATKVALDKGADVNQATIFGDTSLHLALRRTSLNRQTGRLQIINMLVSKGANVNSRNRRGMTPLMEAADSGDTEVVTYFVKHLATIDFSDDEGRTALSLSAYRLYSDIVSILLNAGANKDVRDVQERTPLMQAIASVPTANGAGADSRQEKDRLSVVKLLLEVGADPNAMDKNGWTPIALAAEYSSAEIASELIKRGANVNVRTLKLGNETPLIIAITRNKLASVKALLVAKPELTIVDAHGRTAMNYAQWYQDDEMIDLLRKAGAD